MELVTAWVRPPHQIGGLDHLGVQAPCIQIYSDLLPGITNVTDRARYYSFYPWLLVRFDQKEWRTATDIIKMLRRAECLLSLIGLYHASKTSDSHEDHQAAMVGNGVLSGALEKLLIGEQVNLSDHAHLDDHSSRYFKNPYGGFGQYYFGTLVGLGLLSGDSPAQARVPEETGAILAEIVNKCVPGDLFIQTLIDDKISLQTVSDLVPFCACQLKHSEEERNLLIEIMHKGWLALHTGKVESAEQSSSSRARSQSLAYLCLLTDVASKTDQGFDIKCFRALSYSLHDSKRQEIKFPESIKNRVLNWQVYQRNELLSVGLQGLLFCQLRAAELSKRGFNSFPTTQSLSEWFWTESDLKDVIDNDNKPTTYEYTELVVSKLPPISDWTNVKHEIQCLYRIVRETGLMNTTWDQLITITQDCVTVLAAVLSRPENQVGYDQYQFPDNYLDHYPVNLKSLKQEWKKGIGEQPIQDGLISLSQHYCLDTHLRVAMRKLSQQSKNTFRFEPSEIGLKLNGIPKVANTTPRFKQAVRIMQDLGLLESKSAKLIVTEMGWQFVERIK